MKPKSLIYMAGMAIMLSSCADFFETDSPSTLGAKDVFSNLTRAEQAINGIYEQFGMDRSYRNRLACGYQGLNTDIEYNTKSSDSEYYLYNYQLSGNLSRAEGKDPWGYLNTALERANNAIEGISEYGDTTQVEFAYLLGESYFLRSFVYLEMIKFWGDLPPRFESLAKNPAGVDIPKNDRNIIFEQLRKDLKRAAELMPWSANCPGLANNYLGRPSKAAALALLARMDLMYAGYALRPDYMDQSGNAPYGVQLNVKDENLRRELYAEAMDACAQIINQEDGYKFKETFKEVFQDLCSDVSDYSKTEYIWTIDFVPNARGQFLNYNTSSFANTGVKNVLKHYVDGSTNASQAIVPTFIYEFEAGDLRKEVTVLPYQWYCNNATDDYSNDTTRLVVFPNSTNGANRLWQKQRNIGGFYLGKYRTEWMSRDMTSNDDGVDYPIIRYADVLLMYAEASLGPITTNIETGAVSTTGGVTPTVTCSMTPQEAFDKVRERAGLASKTLNIENVIDERAFELCGEYVRKYDLMRWGLLKHNLVSTMAAIARLDKHEDEYAQTGDSIWFKYRWADADANDYRQSSAAENVYVMDSIWGLNKGENTRPAWFNKENGWVAKNLYYSSSGDTRHLNSNDYYLYEDESLLDSRHYWPIFRINVGASNGTLWNDYGYGN